MTIRDALGTYIAVKLGIQPTLGLDKSSIVHCWDEWPFYMLVDFAREQPSKVHVEHNNLIAFVNVFNQTHRQGVQWLSNT